MNGQKRWSRVWDAIPKRTVLLIVGVLALQLGFVLSYVGAFHNPQPHEIPMSVVAPAAVSGPVVARLNAIGSDPVKAVAIGTEAEAAQRIREGTDSAALIVSTAGTTDTLLVAQAGGNAVATAVTTVITEAESAQHRSVAVRDIVPLQPGDGHGLTGFYLVIGWIIGGYLVSAALGVAKGSRPSTPGRALVRLSALVPYAIVSGFAGALIVDRGLHALTGHFLALSLLGVLLVAGAGAVAMAFQVLFDIVGIGLTIIIFVILGNPSAGGAYAPSLLPPFWRALSPALPNGAGTDTVRRIVYFGGNGITGHLLVLCAYLVGGTLLTFAASWLLHRHKTASGGAPGSVPSPRAGQESDVSAHPAPGAAQ